MVFLEHTQLRLENQKNKYAFGSQYLRVNLINYQYQLLLVDASDSCVFVNAASGRPAQAGQQHIACKPSANSANIGETYSWALVLLVASWTFFEAPAHATHGPRFSRTLMTRSRMKVKPRQKPKPTVEFLTPEATTPETENRDAQVKCLHHVELTKV